MTPRLPMVVLAVAVFAAPGTAQVTDTSQTPVDTVIVTPGADPVVVDTAVDSVRAPTSPRGAFIRSLILPGWGQEAFDAHVRAGVYFLGWAGNWYMNIRNYSRLGDIRNRYDVVREEIRDSLIAELPDSLQDDGIDDVTLDQAVRADTTSGGGNELRKLVRARVQQREDWIAWSIFWLLASGVDAYVTAHLSDFPAAIDVRPNRDRSVSVRLEVPLPRRRP
jgi:hypothetical protein